MKKILASIALIITVANYQGSTEVWRGAFITGATHALIDIGELTCGTTGVSGNMVKATVESMIASGQTKPSDPISGVILGAMIRLGCHGPSKESA